MKTLIGILLLAVLGLSDTTVFAQASSEAPGTGLDLNSPIAPADGPLTPSVALDDVPATPGALAPAPETARPITIAPAVKEALADKSEEEQKRFVELLTKGSQLMQQNEVQGALELIFEAEGIAPDFFALHNLKGAAFSRIRDFDKAIASFKRCLELKPDSMEAKFNLGEMDFVQKKYAPSLDAFTTLLSENPKMPAQTRGLLQYKQYLCLLLLDRNEEAEALLETFRFDSDTPEYYFANAAKKFHTDDNEEAREWLGSAGRIYAKPLVTLYLDSLVEIGWIETL